MNDPVKIVLAGLAAPVESDDGDMVRIVEIGKAIGDPMSELFVRLQSWSETRTHPTMDRIADKWPIPLVPALPPTVRRIGG
jgi:hypothetical protein